MAEIYIALVDTPGLFAEIIRRVIRQRYIHVAIGLDPQMDEAYSIGRRHPAVPLIAGFEKEEKEKILRAFPSASYMICSMECTEEQKRFVEDRLRAAMEERFGIIMQWPGCRSSSGRSHFIRKIILLVPPTSQSCWRKRGSADGRNISLL